MTTLEFFDLAIKVFDPKQYHSEPVSITPTEKGVSLKINSCIYEADTLEHAIQMFRNALADVHLSKVVESNNKK